MRVNLFFFYLSTCQRLRSLIITGVCACVKKWALSIDGYEMDTVFPEGDFSV